MDKQSIRVARKFLVKLREKFKIERLVLFGSRARGDNLKHSDYDFLIVSDDFEKKSFVYRASDIYDFWDLDVDIEPICYTPSEFERKKKQRGIVKSAVREGIEIK